MPKTKRSYGSYTKSNYSSCYPYPNGASAIQTAGSSYNHANVNNASGMSASASSSRITSALEELGAEPKQRRQRKKKDPGAPEAEKREARFKPSCPQNIKERVDRVIHQRFFMIERQRIDEELREEFQVLGSTGNVYTVTIDRLPSCTCPDATKGNHCKHILFIFLKVLQVPQHSSHWYQKALLTAELEEIFRDAPAAPNAIANARVQEAFAQATGRLTSAPATPGKGPKRRVPGPDDDCPICYETMHEVSEKSLAYCESCGNCLHKECFQQWAKSAKELTCVWCRAKWARGGGAAGGASAAAGRGAVTREGYINLSGVAGVSPVRDTSSYYQGPSRGQRHYNYRNYDDDDDGY